ncbi:MAG: DUF3352 domain-containing protein [Cryomorphaceae bacterium]|nr:MAG: DUF3352 domain-containing protein [Cryomorphaceae bacterium]
MIRRYFLAVFVMMIIGAMVYGYLAFKRFNTPVSHILMAAPKESALIIETSDATKLWEKLTHTSVIWEELKTAESFALADGVGIYLDSLLQLDPLLLNQLRTKKAMAVAAPSGPHRYCMLIALNTPTNLTEVGVHQAVRGFLPPSTVETERSYDDNTIHTARIDEHTIHWAYRDGIVLFCTETIPLEEALRNLRTSQSLLNDKHFKKVAKTAGLYADANVYINYKAFGNWMKSLLGQQGKRAPVLNTQLAGWSALDLTAKANQILLNGFVHVSDSANHFFRVFNGQKPKPLRVSKLLPSHTASLLHLGLSHFPSYYQSYREFLRTEGSLGKRDLQIDQLNQQCEKNIEELCTGWIHAEVAIAIAEPRSNDIDPHKYLLFSTSGKNEGWKQLSELSAALGYDPVSYEMFGQPVMEINTADAFRILLGAAFNGFEEAVVTALDDFVILSNSASAMRTLLQHYQAGNTLKKDTHFAAFSNNLADKSNLLYYSGIARSPALFKEYLSKDGQRWADRELETIRRFEGIGYQLSASGDLYYSNIYLSHNPVYTQESGAFWELALNDSITFGPQLVLNHYTQSREILVQLGNQSLSLISNTGKVLWNRELKEPILGKIHQIDRYKNGKLQLLFNTASHVYLIDRNGKHVEGFPVKLKDKASAPLGLFDYDDNRDYRMLVPLANKSSLLFGPDGIAIKGWKAGSTHGLVKDQPVHLRLGNKDYVFMCDEGGNIYLLNRQGSSRHKVKATIEGRSANPVFIQRGKDIKQCQLLYTDTMGNIVSLGFDNNVSKSSVGFATKHTMTAADLNQDGLLTVYLSTDNKLWVIQPDGTVVCQYKHDGLALRPRVFRQQDKTRIAVLSQAEEMIYILNENCKPADYLPMYARGSFTVGDINKDGILNVVAIGAPNTLHVYNLE